MDADIAGYIARQRQAIALEITAMGQIPPIVAALELRVLTDFWSRRGGVSFAPMPGFAAGVIQRGPSANWLWYDPAKDDYRRAFQAFLLQVQKIKAALPADCHVDHVYNRARAKNYGYKLVRMALVPGTVNTDHGRNYEKGIGAAEKGRRPKIMKLLDAMTELKLFGSRSVPSGGSLTDEQIEAAETAAGLYDISKDQALGGITGMRDRAARRP